jgi:hypothetical protein
MEWGPWRIKHGKDSRDTETKRNGKIEWREREKRERERDIIADIFQLIDKFFC